MRAAATQDKPPGHTGRNHPTIAPLPRCARNGCRDVASGKSQKSRVGTTEEADAQLRFLSSPSVRGLERFHALTWPLKPLV